MKIIKRDGRAVDYNREKIEIAIEKANQEVRQSERASKEEIKEIIKYIEELGKKRMLVEDIQDIIEKKLMEINKYELAKKYIVYRYTRALVRKKNTTDESILGLIRNENKTLMNENINTLTVSKQRDYIAGEVSNDLTKRLLLPEKIVKADNDGILHFHDAEYFVQPIFNYSVINISDMLENGTVINENLIETPKNFQVACITLTQIINEVASNQYGELFVDIMYLGKYLKISNEKFIEKYEEKIPKELIEEIAKNRLQEELKSGIQTIIYQINTLMTTNGKTPNVTFFLHLEEDNEFIKENVMIIEELLKQLYKGTKNENGIYKMPQFPKLIYILDELNNLDNGEYDYLTKLAMKCSIKKANINYVSRKKMIENCKENIFEPMKFGKFNQGEVSINLPQIGIIADGDNETFWKLLKERLELCKEALLCRHYSLIGTKSDISPINWKYGAISHLDSNEKINKLLFAGYSTISLGYVGLYEVTKLMTGESHITEVGHKFALKLINYIEETINNWKKEINIDFCLCGTNLKSICYKFAQIDKQKFGIIKDVTDKEYYTKSYHVSDKEKMDLFEKILFENEFRKNQNINNISYIDIEFENKSIEELEKIIKFIYSNNL